MKSKRVEAGRYLVTDACVGSFMVWQEQDFFDEAPQRWFVNYSPDVLGESLTMDGFHTKWEAIDWLKREIERGGWWCRKCEERKETNELQGGMCEACR